MRRTAPFADQRDLDAWASRPVPDDRKALKRAYDTAAAAAWDEYQGATRAAWDRYQRAVLEAWAMVQTDATAPEASR